MEQESWIVERLAKAKIAIEYALSPLYLNRKEFQTAHPEISIRDFRGAIQGSISQCIVGDDIACLIAEKQRQSARQDTTGKTEKIKAAILNSSIKFYGASKQDGTLFKQRLTFMIPELPNHPNERALFLISDYAFSPLTQKAFCEQNAITHALLSRTLIFLASQHCLSDYILNTLEYKALSQKDPEKAKIFFNKLRFLGHYLPYKEDSGLV